MRPLSAAPFLALWVTGCCGTGAKDATDGTEDAVTDDTGADDMGADDTGADDTGADDTGAVDRDGDGYAVAEDCDDGDAAVNPAAQEVCDGADNDCDGDTDAADDGVAGAITVYSDADGDGYGDPTTAARACDTESP